MECWIVEHNLNRTEVVSRNKLICYLPSCLPFDINEANAHLIAAAPEMYAALRKIVSMYPKTTIPEAAIALAKAEGK